MWHNSGYSLIFVRILENINDFSTSSKPLLISMNILYMHIFVFLTLARSLRNDGACGTGGMLIEAIRYIGNDQLTYGKIFGQEKNLATSAIARMNLFLHGAKDVQIVQGDTLRSPAFLEAGQLRTFDCVISE